MQDIDGDGRLRYIASMTRIGAIITYSIWLVGVTDCGINAISTYIYMFHIRLIFIFIIRYIEEKKHIKIKLGFFSLNRMRRDSYAEIARKTYLYRTQHF